MVGKYEGIVHQVANSPQNAKIVDLQNAWCNQFLNYQAQVPKRVFKALALDYNVDDLQWYWEIGSGIKTRVATATVTRPEREGGKCSRPVQVRVSIRGEVFMGGVFKGLMKVMVNSRTMEWEDFSNFRELSSKQIARYIDRMIEKELRSVPDFIIPDKRYSKQRPIMNRKELIAKMKAIEEVAMEKNILGDDQLLFYKVWECDED